jgi:Zn-dependent peptidase ImmA (M78 family)
MSKPSSSLRYGNRERFMLELSFETDPVPDQAAPEQSASWGALKIWANGVNLCTHYEDGELRESVCWNWWPLLNWFEARWSPLLHEQALPVRNAQEWAASALLQINHPATFDRRGGWDSVAEKSADEWFQNHCLWSCREGGLVPNIVIRRFFDKAEISWTNHSAPGAPTHFQFQFDNRGIRLPVTEVAETLHQFLQHASSYVAAVADTVESHALVSRISMLPDVTHFPKRLGLLAGFAERATSYTTNFAQSLKDQGLALAAKTAELFFPKPEPSLVVHGHCQGALMFGAVAPALDDKDRFVIASAMSNHDIPASANRLVEFTNEVSSRGDACNSNPWAEGYRLADEWREACGISTFENLNLDNHLTALGVTIQNVELSDKSTSGAAILLQDRAPLILLNSLCTRHRDSEGHEFYSGRRFTLAHELCHLLVDREEGADLALLSGPWAPKAVEKRANAFAAALLMPDERIEQAYGKIGVLPQDGDVESLMEAASILEVSPDALSHHLHNRRYIDSVQRDALRAQLSNRK